MIAQIPASHIRRYWFGVEDEEAVADTVLLMERDRLQQYQAALDLTTNIFQGVFQGITGLLGGRRLSVIYSIGPAHVADCVSFLAQGFGVKRLIATGSIGGLAAEMGDIVIANQCATQDGYSCAVFPTRVQIDERLGPIVELAMQQDLTVSDSVRRALRQTFDCDIKLGKVFTVPSVSLEDEDRLTEIRARDYLALDLETGPFLGACLKHGLPGLCVHWVTDLPLTRNFYYPSEGDAALVAQDKAKKHRQWLNMPKMILPVLIDLLEGQ